MSVIDVNQIIRNFAHDANTLAEAVSLNKIIIPRLGEPYKSLPMILSQIEYRPNLTLAASFSEKTIIGNTAAQASISVSIDESLTAQMRADGLEIKGTAEPNANIQIKVEG